MPQLNTSTTRVGKTSETLIVFKSGLNPGPGYPQTTVFPDVTVNAEVVTLSKSWVRTPNFRALKRAGTLPDNPFSFKIIKDKKMFGTYRRIDKYAGQPSQSRTRFGFIDSNIGPPDAGDYPLSSAETAAIDNLVVNKLLLQMKDQKVNLAQAFAERQQTLDLLAATAVKIAESFNNLKKGNVVAAARALGGINPSRKMKKKFRKEFERDPKQAAANGWLALQYGWKPLLDDVYGLAELTAQRVVKEIRGSAQASTRRTYERIIPCSFGDYGLFTGVARQKVTYIVKYKCSYWTTSDATHLLTQIGLSNPALIAWELTPYSFVADWFIPIGNWISTFDATLGLAFRSGSKSVIKQYDTTWEVLKGTSDASADLSAVASSRRLTDQVDRTVLSAFPSVTLPSFKNPLSLTHAANALALLKSAFKH